ncbi:MAG: hypothetical protein JWO98_5293, partial [Frankiales bacterium]|nr:hypothetical protein [Frankiales bacterium]
FVLEQSHTLTSADLAYKIVSNAPTAAPIIVDFYIRVGVSFRSYFASVRLAAPINLWTFHAGEALIQTLPTGTASGMTAIVAPDTTWAQPAIRSIDNFDLNFVTNPGRYHGSGLGNAPDISPWFVDVQAFGGHTYQTLMNDGNSGATYQRFNAGGNWSGWIAIADSAGAFVGEIRAGRLAGVNQDFSQSDLNGLQTAGWYKGYGFTNSPLGGTGWFYVDVRVAGAGGYVYQRATAFTDQTGSTFERQLVNGTWTAWTQIADTAGAVDPTARAAAAVKPVTSVAGKTGAVTLAKADVGLGSVDNTADAAKPISTAQAAVNAAKADLVGGVVPTAQIPALALTATLVVASQAAMLALTTAQVQPGDLAVRTDGAGTFILTATDPSVLGNWTRLNAPTDAVVSVNSQVGTVVLAKADVGLGSVDNTADTAKPVSTAQAAALGLKAPLASPTFTGTVAGVTAAMVGAVPTTGGISKLVQITQAAYTALATKDGATLYVVVG